MSNQSGVEYTLICDKHNDQKIIIDNDTTVSEAIHLINEKFGEEQSQRPKKTQKKQKKIKFEEGIDTELIEIFGLSNYTDRSEKFNNIKFPNNELIIYLYNPAKLLLQSTTIRSKIDKDSL